MQADVGPRVVSRVELPDGRMLAFRGTQVVGFNLAEAQRHARRGARTRLQAVAEIHRREDGMWEVSDPNQELDLVSDLAAAVLFSCAALEGLGKYTIDEMEQELLDKLDRLWRLRDGLVRPRPVPEDPEIFGLLMRGDADGCADDAIAVVRALRPDLLPSIPHWE